VSKSSAPKRDAILPPKRTSQPAEEKKALTGSGAIRLNRLASSNPTARTYRNLPAIQEKEGEHQDSSPFLSSSFVPKPASNTNSDSGSPRISWADVPPDDPITEQTDRITQLESRPPVLHARDRAILLRMDGVHAGQVMALDEAKATIGRHPSNDIIIDDSGVSRHHAEIINDGDSIRLIDKNARNGTVVQGVRVQGAVELNDGDFIQFGPRVGFRYSVTDAKQEKLLQRLYESSNRDALTGAYNRKHFDERLLSEIAFAARHDASTALILMDIDHFKKVNDTHGHAAGDAVLRQVSGIVLSRLRTEDVFARIGGEEFAVLLRGVNLAGSARLAERLRTSVSAVPTLFDGRPVPVTISLGCASTKCTRSDTGTPLVRLADERLYKAKNSGRNRVVSS